jgi:pilus assembly protein CpaE
MTPNLSESTIYLLNLAGNTDQSNKIEQNIKTAWPNIVAIHSLEEVHLQSFKQPVQKVVLVLLPEGDIPDLTALLGEIGHSEGHIFYVAIGGQLSGADYKRFIRSGNADWFANGVEVSEINVIIEHRLGASGTRVGTKDPVIISFLPCAGGVGNSTLVIEVAMQLMGKDHSRAGKMCLIDLDFQTSHICDYLDIEPRLKIDEIAKDPKRLDPQLLDIYTSHHSSGIDVLAVPRSKKEIDGLDVAALDVLFGLIAIKYDYILIDLPVLWRFWTEQILIVSQGVVVTGINTIPCLRQISETFLDVRHIEGFSGELRIAINRCEIGILGKIARLDHISSIIGDIKTFFVRYSDATLESVNSGVPVSVAQPTHKFSHDIGNIAQFCNDLGISRTGDRKLLAMSDNHIKIK